MAQAEIKAVPETRGGNPPSRSRSPRASRHRTRQRPSRRTTEAAPKPPRSRKKLVLGAILLAVLAGVGLYGADWWRVGRSWSPPTMPMSAPIPRFSPCQGGRHVVALDVETNQNVKAGDVIARIDDGDYRLALKAAEDKIATQQATIDRYGQQMEAARAEIDTGAGRTGLAAGRIAARRSRTHTRQTQLMKDQFSTAPRWKQRAPTATSAGRRRCRQGQGRLGSGQCRRARRPAHRGAAHA